MIGDKALRPKAIPFEALPTTNASDLSQLDGGSFYIPPDYSEQSRIFPITLSRPEAGQIVELYFTISLSAASAHGFKLKLGIGSLETDYYPSYDFDQSLIDRQHELLTGSPDPLVAAAGATLFIDDLNLLKVIPKPGDANYSSDAIVLLLAFVDLPITTTGWKLNQFRVHGSSQQGLI
jgi:hypothetical protein